MMKIFKTKKAGTAFTVTLIIITLVIFGALAFAIHNNNLEREKEIPIGTQAIALIKIYNEAERANFYVENSAVQSQELALTTIANNAGYTEKNSCKKTQKTIGDEQLMIFDSSCGIFDPEASYQQQFKESLSKYLYAYDSSYQPTGLDPSILKQIADFFNGEVKIDEGKYIKLVSAALIRALSIESNEINNNKEIITFRPIKYPIEFSSDNSYYEYRIKIELKKPSLSGYAKLYSTLEKCREKKDDCEILIKTEFPDAITHKSNSQIKINTNTKYPIKLLFNPDSELPQKPPFQKIP